MPSDTQAPLQQTLTERAKAWLATRRSIPWVVAFGVLCAATSLGAGLVFDDYFFEIVLRKLPMVVTQTGPLDLFRFADGNPKTARGLMDIGQIAWTSDPTTRGVFLRPVSALTHMLDYVLWPHSPALMHAQSLFWFGAAIAMAALVYRRMLGATWVAGLASLLYSIDDTHGPVVAWIANRNAWVAATFGFLVFWLHDRWRRDHWRVGAWLAPLVLAVALLAGESALAIVAYLAAHELHVDTAASKRSRLLALAPYAAVVVAWRAAYTHFGFGVLGSSIYIDPVHSPALFLAALPRRIPFLLLGAVAFPRPDPAELYDLVSPALLYGMLAFAVVVLALFALAIRRLWKTDPVARFFTTGLLLATLPISATVAGDRLLVFVSLGVLGLVAQLIASATGGLERSAARALVVIHIVFAPVLLAVKSASVPYGIPHDIVDKAVPKTPDIAGKTVVLVSAPNEGFAAMLIARRIVLGEPHPAYVRTLAGLMSPIDVTRVDDRTLRIRPSNGFLEHTMERGWRTLDKPLLKGSVVELTGLTVTVTDSTSDLRPAEALFHFDRSLDDPSFVWLYWSHADFVPWIPPAVGATVHVPGYGFNELMDDLPNIVRKN
jgi:hypothetical protein